MNDTKSRSKSQVLTLADIAKMDKQLLVPAEVGAALGCNPYSISLSARTPEGRQGLGFPVILLGSRTKIPRVPFLAFMGWQGEITPDKVVTEA